MDNTTAAAIVTLLLSAAVIIVWWGYEWSRALRERAQREAQARHERMQRIGHDARQLCRDTQAEPLRIPAHVHRAPLTPSAAAAIREAQQAPISSNRDLLDTLGMAPPPGPAVQQEIWQRLRNQWADLPGEWH